jgi:hypothetical protein
MQATVEASISNPIEEFQKLNRALSAKTGDIAKRRSRYRTRILLRFGTRNQSQFTNHLMVIKEVAHNLEKLALPRELAQQLPHAIFGYTMCICQITHPRWIETPRFQRRQQHRRECTVGVVERHRVVRQMQPRPASDNLAARRRIVN